LIASCWQPDPAARPSLEDVLAILTQIQTSVQSDYKMQENSTTLKLMSEISELKTTNEELRHSDAEIAKILGSPTGKSKNKVEELMSEIADLKQKNSVLQQERYFIHIILPLRHMLQLCGVEHVARAAKGVF